MLATNVDLQRCAWLRQVGANIGHPDTTAERRRMGTARDYSDHLAVDVHDGVALARDATLRQDERGELFMRARLARRGDRLEADEACPLLAAPTEARLDRIAVLGQVVAVKVEADLHAKRVASAEARRLGAGLDDRVPEGARVLWRTQDLDP